MCSGYLVVAAVADPGSGPPHMYYVRSTVGGLMERTSMGDGKGRSMKPGICKREYGMEYEMEYGNGIRGNEWNMGIGIWELEYKMKYKKCNGLSAI